MTNRSRIGERVRKGEIQQVRIEYNAHGVSRVTPISQWRPINDFDRARWAMNARAAIAAREAA